MKLKNGLFSFKILTATFTASLVLLIVALIANLSYPLSLIFTVPAVLLASYDKAVLAIGSARKVKFDENLLATLAILGLFLSGHAVEGVCVSLILRGVVIARHLFSSGLARIVQKSTPQSCDTARILLDDGTYREIPTDEVENGSVILVNPYEYIPIDGTLKEGEGEIIPHYPMFFDNTVQAKVGTFLYAGMQNTKEPIHISADRSQKVRACDVVNASITQAEDPLAKSKILGLISKYFAPAIVVISLLNLTLSPYIFKIDFSTSACLSSAMILSLCPTLMLATICENFKTAQLLGFKRGWLFKKSGFIDNMSRADAIVFDGDDNIFDNKPIIKKIVDLSGAGKENILLMFVAMLSHSDFPVAELFRGRMSNIDLPKIENILSKEGLGVVGEIDGRHIFCGTKKLFDEMSVDTGDYKADYYLSIGKKLCGAMVLEDNVGDVVQNLFLKLSDEVTDNLFIFTKSQTNLQNSMPKCTPCEVKSSDEKREFIQSLCENHKSVLVFSSDQSLNIENENALLINDNFKKGVYNDGVDVLASRLTALDIHEIIRFALLFERANDLFAWLSLNLSLMLVLLAIFGYVTAWISCLSAVLLPIIYSSIGLVKLK